MDRRRVATAVVGLVVLVVSCLVWGTGSASAATVVESFEGPTYQMTWPTGGNVSLSTAHARTGSTSLFVDAVSTGTYPSVTFDQPASNNMTGYVKLVGGGKCLLIVSAGSGGTGFQQITSVGTWTAVSRPITYGKVGASVSLAWEGTTTQSNTAGTGCYWDDMNVSDTYTTTTTTAPTTTTTNPYAGSGSSRIETFTTKPFWIQAATISGYEATVWWDQNNKQIFTSTAALVGGSSYQKGGVLTVYPAASTFRFSVAAAGFESTGGCEIWTGPGPSGPLVYRTKFRASTSGIVELTGLTPGAAMIIGTAHDGPSNTDTPTFCAIDNLDSVYERASGEAPTYTDPTGVNEDIGNGPSSTGHDGLDDCIPSGWNLANPFAYIGGIGCALEWAFVPSSDAFDVDGLKDTAEGKVPFSWVGAVADMGPALEDSLQDPGDCWGDLGYSEWFASNLDTNTSGEHGWTDGGTAWDEWDAQWGTASCGEGMSSGSVGTLTHVWAPKVRAIFALLIWVALAVRLLRSAPWSKGRDGGEPG